MLGLFLIILGGAILYISFIQDRPTETLLDRFPGPLTIGVSIARHLTFLAMACGFVAVGIAFIRSPETFSASFASGHHGPVRGEGLLRLLFLHLARDMTQALAVLGWIALCLFGLAGLVAVLKLILSVSGLWGLTLDGDRFTVRAFTVRGKSNLRHRWLDVGDFDSMALSKTARKRYWVQRCVYGASPFVARLYRFGAGQSTTALPQVFQTSIFSAISMASSMAQGVRAELERVEAYACDPLADQAGILTPRQLLARRIRGNAATGRVRGQSAKNGRG